MTLKWKVVKIRKPRRCFSCQDSFDKGDKMIYAVGIWESDFHACYYCLCCNEYINKELEHDDTWGEGDFRGEEYYEQFKREYYARH